MTIFITGYEAGAKAANPNIKVLKGYSQEFVAQAPCKELALDQISKGSQVVFQVAGGCGLGALSAAAGRGRLGGRRRPRPVGPRPAHPHQRGEAGRHLGVRRHQGRAGRDLPGRPGRHLRPRQRGRRHRARSAPRCRRRSSTRSRASSSRSSTARSPRRRSSDGGGPVVRPTAEQHAPPAPGAPGETVLEMIGITKRYPGVVACDDIRFDLRRGEVHALLGENGAGKSTLMNVLYGLTRPDEGEIQVRGEPVEITAPGDAIALGIGMVHQHFMLIPVMTVAENIVLAIEPTQGGVLIDRAEASARVQGDLGPVRAGRRPGRARRGHHGGHGAARRDPEGALPGRRDPDPRRADRGPDPPGDRRARRDPAQPDRAGHVDHLHHPQAQRGAGHRRPGDGAAARPVHRDRAHRGGERGEPRPLHGRPRRRPDGREAPGEARPARAWSCRTSSCTTTAGSRPCAASRSQVAAGEIVGDRGRRRQRPGRAHRRDHGPARADLRDDHRRRAGHHRREPGRGARRGRRPHPHGPPAARAGAGLLPGGEHRPPRLRQAPGGAPRLDVPPARSSRPPSPC